MLGLDVQSLAVPDYEIISRLEKLILAQQSHSMTAAAMDATLEDMSDGFRVGYEDASKILIPSRPISAIRSSNRPTMTSSRNVSRAIRPVRRSRSLSPNRRRDLKAY